MSVRWLVVAAAVACLGAATADEEENGSLAEEEEVCQSARQSWCAGQQPAILQEPGSLRSIEKLEAEEPGSLRPIEKSEVEGRRPGPTLVAALLAMLRRPLDVTFVGDSQAGMSKVDKAIGAHLQELGYIFHDLTTSGSCICRRLSPDFPHCWSNKSALDLVQEECRKKRPDILIFWNGINDMKAQNHFGQQLAGDLKTFQREVSSACGDPKLIVVRPPMAQTAPDPSSTEWPKRRVREMIRKLDDVYGSLERDAGGQVQVVNAQALSNPADFDNNAHFCMDGRRCATGTAIADAIVEAVEKIRGSTTTEVVMRRSNSSMNLTTLLPVTGMMSAPFAVLEVAVAYTLNRLEPPLATASGLEGLPRLPILDVARLVGVLHIVAFHFHQAVSSMFGYGKYWLSFFFFLSGFAHSYSGNGRSAFNNAAHGLSKLYLGYLLSLILFLAAQLGSVTFYELFTTLTLTQAVLPPFHNCVNGPAWYLSTLFVFWLLAPHWTRFADRCTSAQQALLLVFCWLCMLSPSIVCFRLLDLNLNVGGDVPQLVEFNFLSRWPVYLGGLLFGRLVRGRHKDVNLINCSVAVTIVVGSLALLWQVGPPGFDMGRHVLLFDHGFATFPLCCALAWLSLACPGDSRLAAMCGELSYPVYIAQIPVMACVQFALGQAVGSAFWLSLPVIAFGLLFAQRFLDRHSKSMRP